MSWVLREIVSYSWDNFFFSFKKTRLLIKVDDEYIIKIIAMTIHSNFDKSVSYYGSNPVALKYMHIHMYFFCVRRCRRLVAAADVNFFWTLYSGLRLRAYGGNLIVALKMTKCFRHFASKTFPCKGGGGILCKTRYRYSSYNSEIPSRLPKRLSGKSKWCFRIS